MQFKFLNKIRQINPLIHCMTNYVTANYTANGLLALGASPLMSTNIDEITEIGCLAQGILINIGTFNTKDLEAMLVSGKTANRLNKPIVLDPVGIGATQARKQAVRRLLHELDIALIRGNAGEIAELAEVSWQVKGVDAGDGNADLEYMAKRVAKKYQCIVAISGEIDLISNGKKTVKIYNGTPLFPKITGSGCLLGAVCSAFLSIAEQKNYFNAVIEACSVYAVAGELAAQDLLPTQSGQFSVRLLDQLGGITSEQFLQFVQLRNGKECDE
ncbi:hydroxyethylthiazole kinase [Rodentibacter caecimuris]|uniref:Hydroxyethylthiazole kinase n=1 Tax=Rodentibacter caecimuris TaxID=1796644 RepID=A0ABX3KZU4_9PAST|nr:hydroxyethylthiazole kinase [Rodentibacter heylii]